MMRIFVRIILGALLVGVSSAQPAPGVSHAVVGVLQETEIPGTKRQMRMEIAAFPPNAVMHRHESTDPEMIYVLSGQLTIRADGKAPIMLRAGDSYTIPARAPHMTVAGATGAKVLAVSLARRPK
jgi:quercetin dioxygenase-like cupin family protein